MRPIFQWNLGGARTLELGKRTRIMGVVNVTPDSFSDGGQFLDRGGESTRPGAKVQSRTGANVATTLGTAAGQESVTEKEELDRVVPVIAALKQKRADVIVSVDTYKANVARAAVKAGAEIVNDVSGFRWDPEMKRTIAELKCGAVLMHMRGRPDEWKELPPIGDPVLLVKRELRQWAQDAILAGVKRDSLVLDPGFGFGKRFAENYPLVARFAQLQEMGFPILVGTSRKSFIGRTLAANGQDAPTDRRLYGTLATETVLIVSGAHIVRTHDVKATTEVVKIADAIVASG
jgi:dihydropteroate synthase